MFETIYTETVFEVVAMAKAYVLEGASYMSDHLRETLINPKAVELFWELVEEFDNAKKLGHSEGSASGYNKGYGIGFAAGYEEGYKEGFTDGEVHGISLVCKALNEN